jgi:hypothetical protein
MVDAEGAALAGDAVASSTIFKKTAALGST